MWLSRSDTIRKRTYAFIIISLLLMITISIDINPKPAYAPPSFYYSSWDTYSSRKLMITMGDVGQLLPRYASNNNVSGFFHDIFYTKPYFQGTVIFFGHLNSFDFYRSFVKNLATRADVEGYDIVLAVGTDYININDTSIQNRLNTALDYIGNHTSIKMVLDWTEYSDFPMDRDNMINAANNWTRIAERHGARGGFFVTAIGSTPFSGSDFGKYYYFFHLNYPAIGPDKEWVITWGDQFRPGISGVGAGLWDHSYYWKEINVSRYFYKTFELPANDYHYMTWGQNEARLQYNSTVREWIYKYSRLANYSAEFQPTIRVAKDTDPQERLWVTSNKEIQKLASTPKWVNITFPATGTAWVLLFTPSGFSLKATYVNSTTVTPSLKSSWTSGAKLYNVTVTSAGVAFEIQVGVDIIFC